MHRTYTLYRSIYGLLSVTGRVIQIPADSEIEGFIGENPYGIAAAIWHGTPIHVFRQDLVHNGVWSTESGGSAG